MTRRYTTPATVYALAALQHGELVRVLTGGGLAGRSSIAYRFRRRLFGATTINSLIESGAAVRDGDVVRLRTSDPVPVAS